jgi:hypothetical protein
MKTTILFLTALLASLIAVSKSRAADAPSADFQIATAVLAAPEDLRAEATVVGYNAQTELVRLREGKN